MLTPKKPELLRKKATVVYREAEHPTYIVYGFEADVHTLTHKPNHVDVDALTVGNTHN